MIAPSRIASKCSRRKTLTLPVAVMNSSPQRGRLAGGHHLEAVHQRLEGADRVDLDDRDVRAVAGHPRRDPLAHPAVAGDDDLAAGDEDVRRPQDPVERALAGAVAVVEEVLGLGLVDRDDREAEGVVGGHRPQPDDAGRRLLGPGEDLRDLAGPLAVEQRHEVAAVVHRQLRMGVGDRVEVRVVGVAVLAAAGVGRRSRTRRRAPPRRRPWSRAGCSPRGRPRAPPALSVRIRLAVSVVTWRQAPMRRPSSGRSRSKRSRIRRRTGISRSAHSIRRTPSAARPRSVTSWAGEVLAVVIEGRSPCG